MFLMLLVRVALVVTMSVMMMLVMMWVLQGWWWRPGDMVWGHGPGPGSQWSPGPGGGHTQHWPGVLSLATHCVMMVTRCESVHNVMEAAVRVLWCRGIHVSSPHWSCSTNGILIFNQYSKRFMHNTIGMCLIRKYCIFLAGQDYDNNYKVKSVTLLISRYS